MTTRHVCSRSCFVEEDQPALQLRLQSQPFSTGLGYVGPRLLAGVDAFF
jgi:hypothetical protein